jgi:Raf kinase inhibitor-like YbhB/YbcL family protein
MTLDTGLLGLALVAGACSTSVPGSMAIATQAGAPASPSASEVAMQSPTPFTLTSTAFQGGAAIPRRSTCDGEDLSPDLAWTGAPGGTQAFVLLVRDPDARDFLHWLVHDMAGAPDGGLPAAVAASAATPQQGLNDFGKRGYGGPCPPSGEHRYRFTVYALDRALGIGGTPRLKEVEAAMKGHVLAEVTLTGTYRRH